MKTIIPQTPLQIAVLDDYQQVALQMADWTQVQQQAQVSVFREHLYGENQVISSLKDFDIICVMRERTPLSRNILQQLPRLKLIVSTGKRNASIDSQAAAELGIQVAHTGYLDTGTPEMTWALLLALAKNITKENNNLKNNRWQSTISSDLAGKTIGLIGLGRVGSKVARYAQAFDMNVIAWSQNLTAEKATAAGATLVSKTQLLQSADYISLHLVLSERTRHILNKEDLALIKPHTYIINTSRGPLIEENALIHILAERHIAGAALDVYETEPLPNNHPFRRFDNVLATPHTGYVTENTYRLFYSDTVRILEDYLNSNQ